MEKNEEILISKIIYQKSYKYLLGVLPEELDQEELENKYLNNDINYSSLEDVFERFIGSAQNYQSMPNIIKYVERKERIKELLHNYDLNWISKQNINDLFEMFRKEFNFNVNNKNIKLNSWYKWSHSVIDSATFLKTFKTIDEFNTFVEKYNDNLKELPLALADKISGIGFALACDTLRELGYDKFVKPDVHVKEICKELNLCNSEDDIIVFETMVKIAKENDITPYKLDKIFWLISSGNYYKDNIKTKGYKKEFIDFMKKELDL